MFRLLGNLEWGGGHWSKMSFEWSPGTSGHRLWIQFAALSPHFALCTYGSISGTANFCIAAVGKKGHFCPSHMVGPPTHCAANKGRLWRKDTCSWDLARKPVREDMPCELLPRRWRQTPTDELGNSQEKASFLQLLSLLVTGVAGNRVSACRCRPHPLRGPLFILCSPPLASGRFLPLPQVHSLQKAQILGV